DGVSSRHTTLMLRGWSSPGKRGRAARRVLVRAAFFLIAPIVLVVALRAASDPATAARRSAVDATGDLPRQSATSAIAATAERFWPQWRGPHATGVSKHANPPTEWSETKNIRWKVEIPCRGSSSPVIWGDRLYVLSAVPSRGAGAP